jgi:hypothetical protein
VHIVVDQEAERTRDFERGTEVPPGIRVGDAAQEDRGFRPRLEETLHGRELDRLRVGCELRQDVPRDELQQSQRCRHREGDPDREPMEAARRLAEEKPGVEARDAEAGRDVGGQDHVQPHGQGGPVQHRGHGVDVRERAVHDVEAGRDVHPGVRGHHEERRGEPGDGDQRARGQVHALGHAIPAVEVDAQKDRFGEEGDPFQRERHPDDRPRMTHECGPEEAQFEGENRAGDRAHGEEDRRAARPLAGEDVIHGVARALPAPFGDGHEERHAHPDRREHDVEGQRHPHLGARGEQVGHVISGGGIGARRSAPRRRRDREVPVPSEGGTARSRSLFVL